VSPTQRFTPPRCLQLVLAFEVGETKATFHALQVRSTAGRPSQSSTLHGKCWAARTAAEAIIMSSTSAMGMPARFAFFCTSSIMTMNWGMPSACT
jgi:hypothetical protein